MDFFQFNVSACGGLAGVYQVFGEAQFSNPPAGGVLVITVDDGANIYDTIINPPFVSPQTWSISNIPAMGANATVSVVFSAEPGCTNGLVTATPPECACDAEIGTFQADLIGDSPVDYVLCFNDQFSLTSTGGFIPPEEAFNPPGPVYDPTIGYAVYSCPPTLGLIPEINVDIVDDPCWIGVVGYGNSYTEDNIFGLPPFVDPGIVNNTVYYVPITVYSEAAGLYSYVNSDISCYSMGQPYAVQFLEEIVTNEVPDCQTSTVTVTVSGGLPALDGSQFTASALVPATASFDNTTAANNGTINISGLQNGDFYSFDITDDNGCPVTVTGGPFVAVPIADAGADDQACALTYDLQAVASYGAGSWSGGPVGTTFAPNANTANATVTVPNSGVYTFTWTENNGLGCVDSDAVDISFSDISIPAVITNASCAAADGQIVVAPQDGVGPYTYNWTSGGNMAIESNLGSGNVTVTVTDDIGCTLDSTFTITQPVGFNVVVNSADETCFELCDGQLEMIPDGIGPYTYDWTPNVSAANMEVDLCQDDYEVLITDADGCTETVNATVGGPTEVTAVLSADVTEICIGGSAVLSAVVNGGTPPYATYTWVAVPADISLVANDPNPTVSPVVTTTYTLVVTDANGCPSAPVDIVIDVLPPLTLDVIRPLFSPDTSICPYDFATINLTAGGGDGNYNIYLLPDDVNPITLPIDTQPLVTTTFDFMVTDGCTTPPAFTSSTVTVHILPPVMIDAEPDSGCHPLTVEFSDLTVPAAVAWSWNFGDPEGSSNISSDQNPEHLYSGAGTYDVSLSITTAEGCVTDSTFVDYIEVFPLPYASFTLDPEIINLLDADIAFTDLSTGEIVDWRWNFGDGETSSIQSPDHVYTDTGVFIINLVVTTDRGCTDETSRQLIVEPDFTFYVPNAFTPNSDDTNDGFRGYGEGINWDTYQMSIFNRWGELLYYTEDINDPWDGSYKGLQVEISVYVWKIRFYDINGQSHNLYGHVSLVR